MRRGSKSSSCGSAVRVTARAAAFVICWGVLATSFSDHVPTSAQAPSAGGLVQAGFDPQGLIEATRDTARRIAQRLTG